MIAIPILPSAARTETIINEGKLKIFYKGRVDEKRC